MRKNGPVVLILGSGPNALDAQVMPRGAFDAVVAINNAWRVRPDWSHLVFPEDFPAERRPAGVLQGQVLVEHEQFVPAQNALGGFVYGGGTMAFTAGYWALHALRPRVLAFLGCDMVYPHRGSTHFYGTGTADPLRADVTLQSLRAKAARIGIMAARQGCHLVNLSRGRSRLVAPRAGFEALRYLAAGPALPAPPRNAADRREADLGYFIESGRYWETPERWDAQALRDLDALWLRAFRGLKQGLRTSLPAQAG